MTRFNVEFHSVIRVAAGNHLLDKMIADLQKHFPKDYVWKATASMEQINAINVDEHHMIAEALRQNDPVRARSAMTAHVQHAGEILLRHLNERGAAQ